MFSFIWWRTKDGPKKQLSQSHFRQARRNYMGQLQCFIYYESYLDQFYHIQEWSEEFRIMVFENLITIVISYAFSFYLKILVNTPSVSK